MSKIKCMPGWQSQAEELFGPQRHFTEEERSLYKKVTEEQSHPIGINVYELMREKTPKYFRIEFFGKHCMSEEEFSEKFGNIVAAMEKEFGPDWCCSSNFTYDCDVEDDDDDDFEREQYYREEFDED